MFFFPAWTKTCCILLLCNHEIKPFIINNIIGNIHNVENTVWILDFRSCINMEFGDFFKKSRINIVHLYTERIMGLCEISVCLFCKK